MKWPQKYAMLLLLLMPATLFGGEWSGFYAAEGRGFPQSPLLGMQHHSSLSLSFQPEFFHSWAGGDQRILLIPFARLDQHDDRRTHWDIREFYWQILRDDWEFSLGFKKIFWGVSESVHLVDIINQTDLVENLDGEQKLGQPMLHLALIQPWGVLDIYLLTGFRERIFPGLKGRLRFPLPVADDGARYRSGAKNRRLDLALRWSHSLGAFDIGLSHFYGSSREPRLLTEAGNGQPRLIPYYDLLQQSGLDLQATQGGWLWKLEAVSRESAGKRSSAFAGGFEYTFGNIRSSGIDVGILGEYLFDDRDNRFYPPTPFDNDLFWGARLALNDVQSSEILAGAVVDLENGSSFLNIEAARRLGADYKMTVEVRSFLNIDRADLLSAFRRDNHMRIELARYF